MRAGIVGVGAMGMGMAKALRDRGFEVVVRDIRPEREAEAESAGCVRAASAGELCTRVDVVLTAVVDAAQTREVVEEIARRPRFLHDGTKASAPVLLMCSTIAPRDTEDVAARLADQGIDMIDAPISGGPARAREGRLSMMASGSEAAFARCAPVIDAVAARCFRVGTRAGDGSRMKVVNNMLAAANLAAGCEAMAMASRLGLDLAQAVEVVNASSGASWIFADRMPRALARDYAPRAAARVLLKDVGLFVQEARHLGLTAPMAECAREIFHDTVARGFAEEDDAAVLKRYAAAWKARLP